MLVFSTTDEQSQLQRSSTCSACGVLLIYLLIVQKS